MDDFEFDFEDDIAATDEGQPQEALESMQTERGRTTAGARAPTLPSTLDNGGSRARRVTLNAPFRNF